MNRRKCIQIARKAMGGKKANSARERGYTFHHGLRVARLSLELSEQIPGPIEVSENLLFVAAMFHDVEKGREPHAQHGATVIRRLLKGQLTAEELVAAGRIVLEHNRRKNSRSCWIASRIVQDADLLDHYGSHGIWLTLLHSGAHGRTSDQTLAYYNASKHQAHLAGMREALNFEVSRLSFDRRIAMERQFMDRLAEEADGRL
jgi:uncharacterized protein